MQTTRPDRSLLLIVDLQRDFLPGGALAVGDGDAILEPVGALLEHAPFALAVATQDWHPPGHISFASSHAGRAPFDTIDLYGHTQVLWPDHCVQGTEGAALDDRIPWERVRAIVRKGTDPAVDSYSGFRNNWDARGERPSTGLAGFVRELGIGTIYVCGLARDFCVRWTAEDAADLGFETHVVWDLTRPVDPASDADVREALLAKGIGIADSSRLRT